nr:TetR/AcrR family transcriptional regulator [Blastococcus saxobsidens]
MKKARTRAHIRSVAQQMFDAHGFDTVTTADIARRADVAVQTVFNHFPTKEELFFDGRTPWVSGPADAVRDRAPGSCPLEALRSYLVDQVPGMVDVLGAAERQAYARAIKASDTLQVRERELVFESERQLTAALHDAWTGQSHTDAAGNPRDPHTAASVTAAVWLSATRALIVEHRALVAGGLDTCALADDLRELADRLLTGLAQAAGLLGAPSRTTARVVPARSPRPADRLTG